jgi:hypothetical protein
MGFNFGALSMGFGDVLFKADKVYGDKAYPGPVKPLGKVQGEAIANNLENLSAAEDLVGKTNLFSREQIQQMLNSQMPYDEMQGIIGENLRARLQGEIAPDVLSSIGRANAAWGLESGVGAGSGMGGNRMARNLGLTSYGIQQEAEKTYDTWLKTTASLFEPHMMDVTKMFVTIPDQIAQADKEYGRDWLREQIRAMPDPQTVGSVNTGMSLLATIRGSPSPAPVAGSAGSQYAGVQTQRGLDQYNSGLTYGQSGGTDININNYAEGANAPMYGGYDAASAGFDSGDWMAASYY